MRHFLNRNTAQASVAVRSHVRAARLEGPRRTIEYGEDIRLCKILPLLRGRDHVSRGLEADAGDASKLVAVGVMPFPLWTDHRCLCDTRVVMLQESRDARS
jgi:hypothetical protein